MAGILETHSWRPTKAPRVGRTDDIFFLDKDLGWAVNSNGQIIKTTDGFKTFTVQATLEPYLRCCGFANETMGWVGTFDRNARLFRTTDGENWIQVDNLPSGEPVKICGLSVVNENVIYASGTNRPWEQAAILKTTDRGNSWQRIDMEPYAASLIDIFFENENEGWVVGGVDRVKHPNRAPVREDVVPAVLRTLDGGATWTNVVEPLIRARQFPQGEWGWKIQKLSDQTMFVALENERDGAILRSDDGGVSWTRLRINDRQRNSNLEGIGFLDERHGWVGGWGDLSANGGYTSESPDGGKNWHEANHVGFRLNRFRFVGNPVEVGYASGDTVYKFSDEPVTNVEMLAQRAETAAANLEGTEAVSIDISVAEGSKSLTVQIWDRFGGLVKTLVAEDEPEPGHSSVTWDFVDENREEVPAGPYIVRVTNDNERNSMLLYRLPKS